MKNQRDLGIDFHTNRFTVCYKDGVEKKVKTYELDERKVKMVLEDAMKLKELYGQDVKTFLDSF